MGVRGLTTFIAKNASRYLEPHELHDTNLVIDGDNLCSQLYKKCDKGLSAFGGQYGELLKLNLKLKRNLSVTKGLYVNYVMTKN